MNNKNTNILTIEGKDIINSNVINKKHTYVVKKYKKFKATLDYSLETLQLETVAKNVYEHTNIFYKDGNKQKCRSIINLSFKYSVKEYFDKTIGKEKVYVRYDSNIVDLTKIEFVNGLYIVKGVIHAIKVDVIYAKKSDLILPKGFTYEDNKIIVNDKKLKTIMNTKAIRNKLYNEGFSIDNGIGKPKNFVRFKRSSGSSREGKCLFIDKNLYKSMMEWSMMGLNYKETDKCDLAALESYISLTSSNIIDTIIIDPKSILLIEDCTSEFETTAMVTRAIKTTDDKEILFTKKEEDVKIKNNIWDGESLLDSSVFVDNKYSDKGYLLLRNRFVKSACFQCNIQQFFKDNDITSIDQLNGKTLATEISQIKMITTKSSIKYLNFNNNWEEFINQCSSEFGVVKFEKPTHYFDGDMVQCHYQLLNTLQMAKSDVKELLTPTLDYLKLLKNDIRVFRNHLDIKIKENVSKGIIDSSDDLMFKMLQVNDLFINTDPFVNFRQDIIDSYLKNAYKGHLLISGTNSVLFGNGWELLKATIKDKKHKNAFTGKSLLGIDIVYSPKFDEEKELLVCRSPHVTFGNLWLCKNAKKDECEDYKDYFNITDQIICVNSIGNNILERLSSCDFDSDSVLVTDQKLLYDSVLKNYDKFLVPTCKVEAEKLKRYNNLEQKAELDTKTSVNKIGEIVNCSQILNSKLWNIINRGADIESEEVQDLYAIICQLDVMSTLEIDSAKKEFLINNSKELKEINDKYVDKKIKINSKLKTKCKNKKINLSKIKLNRMKLKKSKVKPIFFKAIVKKKFKGKSNAIFIKHRTTMDYLVEILKRESKPIRARNRNSKNYSVVTLNELFDDSKEILISKADRHQINRLIGDCKELKVQTSAIWNKKDLDSEQKYLQSNELKNDFIEKISKLKMTSNTVKKIVNDMAKNKDLIKLSRKMLSILFKSHPENFIEIFEQNKNVIEMLKRTEIESENVIKMYVVNYLPVKIVR